MEAEKRGGDLSRLSKNLSKTGAKAPKTSGVSDTEAKRGQGPDRGRGL